MDFSLLRTLNRFLVAHDGVEDPLAAYVSASKVLFAGLLVAALLVGGAGQRRRRRAGFVAVVATPVALAVAQVVSRLVDRPRPFVEHPVAVALFSRGSADAGFPSDHATASFAIATALVLYDRRWGIVALVLATLLSVGRVALGLHYPTDVLAGAALGAVVALVVWRAARGPLERAADAAGRWRGAALRRLPGVAG